MRSALPLLLASLVCVARTAHANPEWNVAARGSLCRLDARDSDARLAFCAELRGDLLLGRARNDSLAWGPFVSLGSARFADLRPSAGLSLLLPVPSGDFPLVLSAGALSRNFDDARASVNLFWGLRSHNFHGDYAMASGLVLGGDLGPGAARPSTLYAGLQLDGLWLALPFILGYEWLRGSPGE
jgi:hypothetical protein